MSEPRRPLAERLPAHRLDDPDQVLDLFLEHVADLGLELYPAQEEGLLELFAGRHVVLQTPTGSGKSLVALGLHCKGLCEGRTSFYTSPIKALASEKFFALCSELGADNVGMLTGDASINPGAPVVCCTAEVLANLALRRGDELDAPYVVMDEFHYYSDPERGVAWQVPLITLPRTQFLLMSATLGDMSAIAGRLEAYSGRPVAVVSSTHRPVPLEFDYRETPIHETVEWLLDRDRAPVYVVNFTQRECAELAQSLTSLKLAGRDDKERIAEQLKGSRFDTPYGREFRRFLSFGIGVHHAGLLPRYRLKVEQLAQAGLLKVVSGTDTLGVGVNIPIRTVLFTGLAKFDGHKVAIMRVRDFKQIAGRAGRKGFDDRGWVVCQAPEHVVERAMAERRAGGDPKKMRKIAAKKPEPGTPSWSRETFDRLVEKPPEPLRSRFRLSQGMILDLLQRDAERDDPSLRNFASLRQLIANCHDEEGARARHISQAAQLARSLYRAGVIRMERDRATRYLWVVVDSELQVNFSLFHNLSLFLVEAIATLDPASPTYALDLLSLAESVLENPEVILRRQVDALKTELVAMLKADGVSYEERMALLDQVTHPQPAAELILAAFDRFREVHPWVAGDAVQPKSIGREMVEQFATFTDYVKRYGLQRSEGVLLRYLSQLYKTLHQNVPDAAKDDAVWDVVGFLRATIERVDTSLIEEWELLLHPELRLEGAADAHAAHRLLAVEELLSDRRAFAARLRAELHQLVACLARRDFEEAATGLRHDPGDPTTHWTPEGLERALQPFVERFGAVVFDHRARLAEHTQITADGDRQWRVVQVLLDPEGENLWCVEGRVDLSRAETVDGPLVAVHRIGT